MTPVYFHVDLDAFFASVEQLDHPEYRGKPLIVGGEIGGRRSVVSTASYEARKFGVHSAMPIFQAAKLCPNGIFIPGNLKRYQEKSREVMSIFYNYSPDVQQMSVDEAFIDMTGTEKLFGAPEEAAKKIKAEILEKTGLTVSIGIASTKYCAKIASGLQKPDGLTVVKPGEETQFMLSLPLEKLWGAGTKTQERLRNIGITKVSDIYSRSEGLLKSVFGNATGSFLYHAVRGNEYEDFNNAPKSRSISAESTYEYDLIDSEAMETALLELCHTVMFRSLKEKVRSKSLSIKIRYEDFTTVSIQETSERYISSVDDLFERTKNLFHKKYKGRLGIRLFGVCMQNLEDDTKPREMELFDFGEEKKRKVEQAILKAEQKNPALKITKARLLNNGIKLILLGALIFSGNKANAQKQYSSKDSDAAGSITFDTSKIPLEFEEGPVSIFRKDFEATDIEFLAEGYWKTSLEMNAAYSFGFGSTPGFSAPAPVFAQNVDLTLWFMANKKWYFEAAFADEFEKNTVAAGYQGEGYLKSARIGNRGIVFPHIYAIDEFNRGLGGGENQAPGASFNWNGEKWQADLALRYDQLSYNSKNWYGKNAVSENSIAISDYLTGSQYVLHSESALQNVKDIYVEAVEGEYTDKKGRKYSRLSSSQYLLVGSTNSIVLSKDAKAARKNGILPAVAVSFYDQTAQEFTGALSSSAKVFLKDVEDTFENFDLTDFYYDFTTAMETDSGTETVLFLQHPSGFSPFQNASRYDGGTLSVNDAAVASTYSQTVAKDYSAVISEDETKFSATDFFYKNHTYIDVFSTDSKSDSIKSAENRFPFAKTNPSAYLNYGKESDLAIRIRSYSPVTRLDIGTKAVAGTVQVYKNSVLDTGASYDAQSGSITLSTSVQTTDHIQAIWQEEAENPQNASFALAAGFKQNINENLTANASVSSRISYSDKKFTDDSYSSPVFGTFAAGVEYKNDLFQLKNSVALSGETFDINGNYRILGMNDCDSQTYYLIKSAGVNLPEGFVPSLNSKNQIFPQLKGQNKAHPAENGHGETEISGYAVPVSWEFSQGSEIIEEWAAQTINLPAASALSLSTGFEIALKNQNPYDSGYDLYLQLGVSNEEDFTTEDSEKIPTWLISDSTQENVEAAFDAKKSGWQTVRINFSKSERAFFAGCQNQSARIIAVKNSSYSNSQVSTIFAGPYQCLSSSFIADFPEEVVFSSYEAKDTTLVSSKIKDFNGDSDNTVQIFEWKYDSIPLQDESKLVMQKYFQEVDFSNYKKMSFWLKTSGRTDLSFALDTIEEAGTKTAVSFEIPSENLSTCADQWIKITVDFKSKKVEANGRQFSAFVDTTVIPTRFTITAENKSPLPEEKYNLAIDELHLSETAPFFTLQDKLAFNLEKKGTVISAGQYDLVKDIKINAIGNGTSRLKNEISGTKNVVSGSAEIEATIANLRLNLAGGKDSETKNEERLSSASHSISTASPVLNVLSFSENYSFNPPAKNLEKSNSAKLDLSSVRVPVIFSINTESSSDQWSRFQKICGEASFKIKNFSFSAKTNAEQKIQEIQDEKNGNYFEAWKNISELEFSRGNKAAAKRNIGLNISAKNAFNLLKLSPSISFESKGSYKSTFSTTFADDSKLQFALPFAAGKNSFNFSYTRSSGSAANAEKGGNYAGDMDLLSSKISQKAYFLKSIPIAELFSSNLAKDVKNAAVKADSKSENFTTYYTGLYELGWKRSFSGSKYDFFIPRSTALNFSRDIRAAESISDLYQIKQSINFSAMNLFGSKGSLSHFRFYEQDEFITSISAGAKIPKNQVRKTTVLINGYTQATFFMIGKDSVKAALEGTVESSHDWDGKATLVWKRNGKDSVAAGIYSFFKPETPQNQFKITQTDSLNAGAASSTSASKLQHHYNLDYSHQTDTQINKFVTLNTAAGLGYYTTWNKIAKINGTLTLGATLKF